MSAAFTRDGREWLRLESRLVWLHSVHGSGGEHLASLHRLSAMVPLLGAVGVGGDFAVATRHSTYPDFPSVTQRIPEMRAYLTWAR